MLQRTRSLSGIRNLAGVTTEELKSAGNARFLAGALAENSPGHEAPVESNRRFEAGGVRREREAKLSTGRKGAARL